MAQATKKRSMKSMKAMKTMKSMKGMKSMKKRLTKEEEYGTGRNSFEDEHFMKGSMKKNKAARDESRGELDFLGERPNKPTDLSKPKKRSKPMKRRSTKK